MISLIYLKKNGGTVKIHDQDVVNKLIGECQNEHPMEWKKSQRHSKKKDSTILPASASATSVHSKSQTNQSERSQEWLNKETIKEIQSNASNECQAAKRLYTPFLETEGTFIQELDELLAHKELTDLRKKELLHKRWTEQVYEPIRKTIIAALDGSDWYKLYCHKREMHRQYLEHVNKRGFVFLSDDDRQEYYAHGYHSAPVKIKAQTFCDPLLIQKRQRYEEDETILRCMTGHHYSASDLEQVRLPPLPLIPQGRHGVNSCLWLEMPHYNIDNVSKEKNRHRVLGDSAKSNIDFRAWAHGDCDAKTAAQELHIPHKRMFKEHPPYGKPPVIIPHVPFIDPEDFVDKIINTNPFPQHMTNLKAEAEAMREMFQHQQYFEDLEQQHLLGQDKKQEDFLENNQPQ